MTQPRLVLPGDVVFCTVRTIARFYLLRPEPELLQGMQYVLGHYSTKYSIRILAVCAMSTHVHMVIEDTLGNRPEFLRDVHRGFANIVKAMRGWRGAVFASHHNQTRLLSEGAIINEIGYTLANPVAAGAVKDAKDWPGLRTEIPSGQTTKTIKRPKHFYGQNSSLPETATLTIYLPSSLLERYGAEHAAAALRGSIQEHEQKGRKAVRSQQRGFVGAKRCQSYSPFLRATTHETSGGLNPTFAVRGAARELYRDAVKQLRAFRCAYRSALLRWREGLRDTVFPAGTYLMRILQKVTVAEFVPLHERLAP